MVWSTCSVLDDKMRDGVVRDLTVEQTGDTWSSLRWSLPCSERSGLVLRYIITWCHVATCHQETVSHVADLSVGKRLEQLEPWTDYRINVTVVTDKSTGHQSNLVSIRTLASTPASPPLSLSVDAKTNNSAVLSWSKPHLAHGPISHYKVLVTDILKPSLMLHFSVFRFIFSTMMDSQIFLILKARRNPSSTCQNYSPTPTTGSSWRPATLSTLSSALVRRTWP